MCRIGRFLGRWSCARRGGSHAGWRSGFGGRQCHQGLCGRGCRRWRAIRLCFRLRIASRIGLHGEIGFGLAVRRPIGLDRDGRNPAQGAESRVLRRRLRRLGKSHAGSARRERLGGGGRGRGSRRDRGVGRTRCVARAGPRKNDDAGACRRLGRRGVARLSSPCCRHDVDGRAPQPQIGSGRR